MTSFPKPTRTSKVRLHGGSHCVLLSRAILFDAGMAINDLLRVDVDAGCVILTKIDLPKPVRVQTDPQSKQGR